MMAELYTSKGAQISACGKYRWKLWREWRLPNGGKKWRSLGFKDGAGIDVEEPLTCLFVMFNPSTADGEIDDPTIRRCVGFAKRFGYERMEVVNLFAYRATNPSVILSMGFGGLADPEGVENQQHVKTAAANAGLIICAWGANGSHLDQAETVRGWLDGYTLCHLGLTKDGHPRHPLYLKTDATVEKLK